MSSYRDQASEVHREARWTFWRFLPMFIVGVVLLFGLFFGLRALGVIGGTVVERKAFEQSYQRSEAIKAQIAHEEAVIVEIERKLANPNLDADTRANLEAQASAARIRLQTARSSQ